MGLYISTDRDKKILPQKGKLDVLKDMFKGGMEELPTAPISLRNIPSDKTLLCVIAHDTHDAVAVIWDQKEWDIKCRPSFEQPRRFFLVNLEEAAKLADINFTKYRGTWDDGKRIRGIPGMAMPGIGCGDIRARSGYAGTVILEGKCPVSGKWYEVMDLTLPQLKKWADGDAKIQEVFRAQTGDQREFILNGITPWGWDIKMEEKPGQKALPSY